MTGPSAPSRLPVTPSNGHSTPPRSAGPRPSWRQVDGLRRLGRGQRRERGLVAFARTRPMKRTDARGVIEESILEGPYGECALAPQAHLDQRVFCFLFALSR